MKRQNVRELMKRDAEKKIDKEELVLVKMNGGNLMDKDPFKEYIKQSEPSKRDKGYAWHTAIGLQAVDGLKTSKYLIDTAIKKY